MERYCSCNRGIGFCNRTSVVRDSRGVEVCAHCGGVVPPEMPYDYDPYRYPNGFEHENDHYVSPLTSYYEQARACSIKGDHVSAIGFYKEILRKSGSPTDCEVLSAIADEYEAMGHYTSAEDYWVRCCSVKRYDSYKYIARKGDFLYRRERYEESVDAYEEALRILNGTDDRKVNLSMLEYYARITHFIIISYKALGKNNPEEKCHEDLKHEVRRYINASINDDVSNARFISHEAWRIYESDRMTDEALILIDFAIKLHPVANNYERKAIFIKNKLEIEVIFKRITPHDLDLINEALEILPKDCDNGPYLKTKGDILNQLGDPVKARVCFALAYKHYDEVEKADKQLKKLKSCGTYINITGIHYYKHFEPFSEGTIVDLIKEPDNKHDPYAIRVEINGETVGYVANSRYTVIKQVSSATDIKDTKSTKAEVQFILFNEWVVAKLI